ncbi:MAG TPA: hypothetical protein VFH88_13100, partial [Candidatus Krumholzibacteria bacterium]|nr:hypothetical protein [Candidatus Krumholzibacteria bacterium]
LRDGLALAVTHQHDLLLEHPPTVRYSGRGGISVVIEASRVDDGMTFPGALRAASAGILERDGARVVRAGAGLQAVRE